MMKNKIFILILIILIGGSAYAQQPSGTLITAPIRPNDIRMDFPTAYANEMLGGHHQVATIGQRDSIMNSRRIVGMLCTVLDDGTGNPITYQLIGGTANSNWIPYNAAANLIMGTGLIKTGDTIHASMDSAFWNARKLMGYNLSTATPDTNYLISFDGSSWVYSSPPQLFPLDSHYTGGVGITIDTNTKTISANNTQAIWNANKLQDYDISTSIPQSGQVLKWDGSEWAPGTDTGNVYTAGTGLYMSANVIHALTSTPQWNANQIQSRNISNVNPVDGNVLIYDSASFQWVPAPMPAYDYYGGTGITLINDTFHADNDSALWNAQKIQGNPISNTSPAMDQVLKWNGSLWVPSADVNTNYSAGTGIFISANTIGAMNTIPMWNSNQIQGRPVSSAAPSANGQVLKWNSTTFTWEPGTDENTTYISGTGINISSTTINAENTTALWNADKLQGNDISTNPPSQNKQVLAWDTANSEWAPLSIPFHAAGYGLSLSNDTFSANANQAIWNASKLQNTDIDTSSPSNNQILTYNSISKKWEPQNGGTANLIAGNRVVFRGDTINMNDSFNGLRTITRQGLPGQGSSLGANTFEEFLSAYFFPTEPPLCSISGSGSSTLEFKSTSSAAIQVNLNFSVNLQSTTADIDSAVVTCNQSISGFPHSFFSAPGSNNQSGSLSGINLVDNVSNTFTVTGITEDGKSCSSSKTYIFRHKRYWGAYASALPPTNPAFSISDAQIIALTGAGVGSGSEFASNRQKTYTGINGAGNYLVFAFPSSWGSPSFIVNGFASTAFTRVRNNAFINASGYSETFQVWVSNSVQNSPLNIEIQ
jgi:uncharacterized protein (DUF2237 family)